MIIDIHIHTGEGITEADRNVILALAGLPATDTSTSEAQAEEKAAPKKRSPRKAKEAPVKEDVPVTAKEAAAVQAHESGHADETPAEEEEATKEATKEEAPAEENPIEVAVQKATALVAGGKASLVKKALGTVGAKRVSELTEDQVPAFLAELG